MSRISTLIFAICFLATGAAMAAQQPFFSDVPTGHWASDAVKKAAHLGLVVGHGDGKFEGEKPPTRYEMAMGMAKVLAELENRLKAFPGISNEVLQILEKINLHFASQIDALRTNQASMQKAINELYRAQGRPIPFTDATPVAPSTAQN